MQAPSNETDVSLNSSFSGLRVGLGQDRHRLQEGLPLVLGGVSINEAPYGCIAHSDGDVVLHALMDALLATVGAGDIGEWFPPEAAQWKNANSAELLKTVLSRLRQQLANFRVINVSVVIQLEAPKLRAYKKQIQQRLANLLAIEASCVAIQAKTGEGLAPVGTHQAIDATVVVLICL